MSTPKISVIVNFYNGEKYLDKCLNSIINQNYRNIEIILWDNCSDDNSYKKIRNYTDDRIKYIFNKKKVPLYKARNDALLSSKGQLIAFLDCDDWWDENYLSSRKEFFYDKELDFFYSNANFFYQNVKKSKIYKKYQLPQGYIFDYLSKDYFLIISGIIFRKNIFTKYGLFNENYNIIGDYDYLLKISKFCKAHSINEPLLNYRVHEKNFSKLNSEMFFIEYKDWFDHNLHKDKDFLRNIKYFEKKLSYLEISHLLLNDKKNFNLIKKILKYKSIIGKIKFIILFLTPKKFFKYLKK
tara:strand:- start:5915 stop:6805 length:891 start_codon:yes stop_codon:yes gene_type:complete